VRATAGSEAVEREECDCSGDHPARTVRHRRVRTRAYPANGAFLSPLQGRAGGQNLFCGMVFFVARRNQSRKVEVTVGDIFAS
jgi:hypothetical protein